MHRMKSWLTKIFNLHWVWGLITLVMTTLQPQILQSGSGWIDIQGWKMELILKSTPLNSLQLKFYCLQDLVSTTTWVATNIPSQGGTGILYPEFHRYWFPTSWATMVWIQHFNVTNTTAYPFTTDPSKFIPATTDITKLLPLCNQCIWRGIEEPIYLEIKFGHR